MQGKAKILLMITKADVGGAQIHVLDILKNLCDQYEFVLASGEHNFLTIEAGKLGIEVRVLAHLKRSIKLKEDRLAYLECIELLKEIKPDLLHLHSSKAGVIGRLAAWRSGIPSVFTAHGWAFTEGVPLHQKLYSLLIESVLCRLSGDVITISKYDYALAAKYHVGSLKRRHLIQNGISEPDQVSHFSSAGPIQILSIGRLSSTQKNQAMLLQALSSLDLDFQATIIGEGESRPGLEQQLNQLKLNHKVRLPGEIVDVSDYLLNADIFVLSSNYEGLPLSILEAMSMGLPVVSTDVGGVNEAVVHQQTGLLSARGDVQAFADNIVTLANDEGLRKQYGKNARQRYLKYFTAARMIEELGKLYKDLTKAK